MRFLMSSKTKTLKDFHFYFFNEESIFRDFYGGFMPIWDPHHYFQCGFLDFQCGFLFFIFLNSKGNLVCRHKKKNSGLNNN